MRLTLYHSVISPHVALHVQFNYTRQSAARRTDHSGGRPSEDTVGAFFRPIFFVVVRLDHHSGIVSTFFVSSKHLSFRHPTGWRHFPPVLPYVPLVSAAGPVLLGNQRLDMNWWLCRRRRRHRRRRPSCHRRRRAPARARGGAWVHDTGPTRGSDALPKFPMLEDTILQCLESFYITFKFHDIILSEP